MLFRCKVLGAVAGLEPANRRKTQLTLHRQHDTPYIYSLIQAAGSHTSLRQQPQSPSALLDLQSGFRISIVLYVAVLRQPYSAFNSHNFPRTMVLMVHATTFQPYCSHRDLTRRSSLVRKLPRYVRLYLRVGYRLFPLHPL